MLALRHSKHIWQRPFANGTVCRVVSTIEVFDDSTIGTFEYNSISQGTGATALLFVHVAGVSTPRRVSM